MTTTRLVECAEEIHETARELIALGPALSAERVEAALRVFRANLAVIQSESRRLAEAVCEQSGVIP
jgi:hypothetical protein